LIGLVSPFRIATPADAQALAELVQFASEGLAFSLWTRIAPPGVDPWTIGRERGRREMGPVSYRSAILVEGDSRVAAGLIGYPLADAPEPAPQQLPPIAAPLQELQEMAPGTWYVNVLAASAIDPHSATVTRLSRKRVSISNFQNQTEAML
jgi:hypothetical protein